jgi:hypothetical protein
MSRPAKVLLIGVGLLAAFFLSLALLVGTAVYGAVHEGVAVVSVNEKKPHGTHLWLPVPVAVVHTALQLMPPHDRPVLDPEAQRWLPMARTVLEALEDSPDGVFVDVTSSDEHVVIAKRNGRLVVDVESKHESVHVSLPAGTLAGVLAEIETWPTAPRHSRAAESYT